MYENGKQIFGTKHYLSRFESIKIVFYYLKMFKNDKFH